MTARELYQAGRLGEAVQTLNSELREDPGDVKGRIFLFELLCFAGNYARAEKQLEILAQESPNAQMGALVYRAALEAERTRCEMFQKGQLPSLKESAESNSPAGTWNGVAFGTLEDADPRIGPRLEVFAGGQYLWIPFEQIASIEMQAPRRLRDLLWAPAVLRMSETCRDLNLGEVLVPALTPLSFQEEDEAIQLGRVTDWKELNSGEVVPVGRKMFRIDGEEVSVLELRHVEFHSGSVADQHASA